MEWMEVAEGRRTGRVFQTSFYMGELPWECGREGYKMPPERWQVLCPADYSYTLVHRYDCAYARWCMDLLKLTYTKQGFSRDCQEGGGDGSMLTCKWTFWRHLINYHMKDSATLKSLGWKVWRQHWLKHRKSRAVWWWNCVADRREIYSCTSQRLILY